MAALWDFFVQTYGRPTWTYLVGVGGSAVVTRLATIQYANRFDGALTLCGIAGDWAATSMDFFVAGAFAAGVTQEEFDETEIAYLIDNSIRPALVDETAREQFEELYIRLAGGPRPFAREGLVNDENLLWEQATFVIGAGYVDNIDVVYDLRGEGVASEDAFNAGVVRRALGNPDLYRRFSPGATDSYALRVPLLTYNTTGNPVSPISVDQQLRRMMNDAGSGDLLVQRTVRNYYDCGLGNGEWVRGLADLVRWVEHGEKPAGENLLEDDLKDIGEAFTRLPNVDAPESAAVPGAAGRLLISGAFKFDGELLANADTWVVVVNDGIMRPCSYWYWFTPSSEAGRYQHKVAADAEAPGCGRAGARAYVVMYSRERRQEFISQEALEWSPGTTELTLNATFSSANPVGAGVGDTVQDFLGAKYWGVVLDAAGEPMPPGTFVEAFVGDTRCGWYTLPVVQMASVSPNGEAASYAIHVSGPELLPDCTRGAAVSFRVNGETVAQTGINTLEFFATELDLRLEE